MPKPQATPLTIRKIGDTSYTRALSICKSAGYKQHSVAPEAAPEAAPVTVQSSFCMIMHVYIQNSAICLTSGKRGCFLDKTRHVFSKSHRVLAKSRHLLADDYSYIPTSSDSDSVRCHHWYYLFFRRSHQKHH